MIRATPILFVDVDGVLNRAGFRPAVAAGLASWIEPELAHRLSDLVAATGAAMVVASTWREGRTLDQLRRELGIAGVVGAVVDATPVLHGAPRWHEIRAWLDRQPRRPDRFAILDDERDMGELAAHHVRVRPLVGLDDDACEAARGLLGPAAT